MHSSAIHERSTDLSAERPRPVTERSSRAAQTLERYFGVSFAVFNTASDQWVQCPADQPTLTSSLHAELCRAVSYRQRCEIIGEEVPFSILAVPLETAGQHDCVAVATFRTAEASGEADVLRAVQLLDLRLDNPVDWTARQRIWPAEALVSMAELVTAKWTSDSEAVSLRREVDDLSRQLSSTYEEICLLFRLTQSLTISSSVEDLARLTLHWLAEAIPAKGLAIQIVSPEVVEGDEPQAAASLQNNFYSEGDCPIDSAALARLVDRFGETARRHPVVINPPISSESAWPCGEVSQLVLVPLTEGENLFGWLTVMNHRLGQEFGTVEASLLSSVAAILGIHAGNLQLYRQQAEFMAGVVRALTSAIDAKDPYTCGHSDRVARVSVRLAQQLGCTQDELKTIYLSGLLHDVGKIGIDDGVLRKPGRLTDAEFEHIKTHAEIGYRILKDIKQLDNILPVVRHHHECYDGTGYPHGLAATNIPFMARIVAVADAFDAMSSDRPYRPGMPDAKLDKIMREGAGTQWDAKIVEAFFQARDDIRDIAHRERMGIGPEQWV